MGRWIRRSNTGSITSIYYILGIFICVGKFLLSDSAESIVTSNEINNGLLNEGELSETKQNSVGGENHTGDIVIQEGGNFSRPWVAKCCYLNYGFTFENRSVCVMTEDEFLPDFEDWPDYSEKAKDMPVSTRYEYFIGDPCPDGKYILDLAIYPYDKYLLYTNGTLLYLDRLYSIQDFCLETLNNTIRVFMCFGSGKVSPELDFMFILYASGLIISIPFLVATALVYLSIEMFRDLRGKSLSCHVLCLATGYLFLALVQLASDQLNEDFCIGVGFIIQFFFVAAFFWLNVICYDTWCCINNDFRCTFTPPNLKSEKIKFWCYSAYAWYSPVILSIVSLIMDLEPAIPESYLKPNFGLQSCWFYSDDAALPYFYGPVGVIICINIIFFILSMRKIYLEQKRRRKMLTQNKTSIDDMPEKLMSIKFYTKALQECFYLFCIMGINWTAEVVSWAVGGSKTIWLMTDLFNALQGVMIFYLFVLKPSCIRKEVKRQLGILWKRIIKCDCSYKEQPKRVSRHWHANIQSDITHSIFDNENGMYMEMTTTMPKNV